MSVCFSVSFLMKLFFSMSVSLRLSLPLSVFLGLSPFFFLPFLSLSLSLSLTLSLSHSAVFILNALTEKSNRNEVCAVMDELFYVFERVSDIKSIKYYVFKLEKVAPNTFLSISALSP